MSSEFEKRYLIRDFNGKVLANWDNFAHFGIDVDNIEDLLKWILKKDKFISQAYFKKEAIPKVVSTYFPNLDPNNYDLARIRNTRIKSKIKKNIVCIKGKKFEGGGLEKEDFVTPEIYTHLLSQDPDQVSKYRRSKKNKLVNGSKIEVDCFKNNNSPLVNKLIIAEIEFPSRELMNDLNPLGLDITENHYYSNINLSRINRE